MNSVTHTPPSTPVTRPARVRTEVRALLTLAFPIIISQIATTAMGFVDAVMAGRVGPRDLAAVALGNSIWVPVFLLMSGILLATTPKVAQRFGADAHSDIGPIVRQALWLALITGLCAALILIGAEPLLHGMKVDPDLIEPSMGYLYGIASGMPAVGLYCCGCRPPRQTASPSCARWPPKTPAAPLPGKCAQTSSSAPAPRPGKSQAT